MVNGTPAADSMMPRLIPAMPAPTTTTWKPVRSAAGSIGTLRLTVPISSASSSA
jgi:hypothetical protein